MSKRLLAAQLIVLGILAVLHATSLENDLYWHFIWLDLVSHTLGGLWAGLCVLWLAHRIGIVPSAAWPVAGALALGIAWEIFERAAGLEPKANYVLDTSLDLLMDVVGGVLAAVLTRFLSERPDPLIKQ